jgi:flagellar protein FliL
VARKPEPAKPAARDKKPSAAPDDGEEAAPAAAPRKRGLLKLIIIAVVVLLILGGGGGGAWYFFFAGDDKADASKEKEVEPPVPAFVEVKAFVVTIKDSEGAQHYLQLGMNMKVPGPDAVTAVSTVLPEVLDTMRQTILGYKADELETQDGVNKMRVALVGDVNAALVKALGPGKIKKLGDDSGKALVENIFFSSLVVE